MTPFQMQIPASSANIGPGFDSIGIALSRYLTIKVEPSTRWEIKQVAAFLPEVTNIEDHFIYQIAVEVATLYEKTLPPCELTIDSEIPLARGLGSSSTAIIAGMELANRLCKLDLTRNDLLEIGVKWEGHPDNIAPTLFGGLVIATVTEQTHYIKTAIADELDIITYIPTVELKTKKARNILPDHYSRDQATKASGVSNVMIAALLSGNFTLAGKMMEGDIFHEPYRASLIPNYDLIQKQAQKLGAYGTVISGAGPTMLSFVPKGDGERIASSIKTMLPDVDISTVAIDKQGLIVF